MKSQERRDRKSIRYSKSAKMTEAQQQEHCKFVAELLNAAYPGHLWAVSMQHRMVYVRNLNLSSEMGFAVDMANIGPEGKEVVMYDGELLERFRQRRGWIDEAAIKNEKRNLSGNIIHDD